MRESFFPPLVKFTIGLEEKKKHKRFHWTTWFKKSSKRKKKFFECSSTINILKAYNVHNLQLLWEMTYREPVDTKEIDDLTI